ncbi:MAG: ABC-F family ATP-binding cassette domain-containing protein [Promicromonosporaceae bacterium]|nr:ABC-F family ATP-binding cassette domain-containing protein [Promicromonosporaceae bacterium]
MAHLLGAEGLHLQYPTRVVFDSVTLGLDEGDRIGVVGRNGDGKSTLLRLLARRLEPDAGRVTWRGGLRFGVLDQADTLDDDNTVGFVIVGHRDEHEWAGDPRVRDVIGGLVSDLSWTARIGTLSGGQRRRVALAALLVGEWDVLALDEPTNHLDVEGIAWLAAHLRQRWRPNEGALLLITHDRWFLDEVALTTWEVHSRRVEPFEGGYAAYVLARVERDRQAAASEAKRQNLLRKELAWLRRGAPARTSKPKFRIDAANALISDVPPPRDRLELSALAVSRLGKDCIDLLDVSVAFPVHPALPEAATGSRPLGEVAPTEGRPLDEEAETERRPLVEEAQPSRNPDTAADGPPLNWVLRDIEWLIAPGERTAILGANGSGKSTLLRLIAGEIAPPAESRRAVAEERRLRDEAGGLDPRDPGGAVVTGRVKRGRTVKLGVLDQQFSQLADIAGDRVREVLARTKTSYVVGGKELTPAQLLERLGFSREHLSARVDELSGGQKRRLQLLLVLLAEPNVLLLDEPSNDVDTDMLAAMEDLLDSWPGTLIVVSHDRYLLERVADQQYALIDGRLRHLPGGVDEYLRLRQAPAGQVSPDSGSLAAPPGGRAGKSPSATATPTDAGATVGDVPGPGTLGASLSAADLRQARKDVARLEKQIARLESQEAELHGEIAANATDYALVSRLDGDLRTLQDEKDALEAQWLEAAEALG